MKIIVMRSAREGGWKNGPDVRGGSPESLTGVSLAEIRLGW